jgi:hypothetical protein
LPIAVTIESYPPPPVIEEVKAEKRRDRRLKWGSFAASVATALITLGILCVTRKYTNYAKGQLRVMDGQLKTMQNQLELQERPWIKITDVQTRGNGPIIPALSFQRGAGMPFQQATFQLKISLKNIGHSVAEIAPRFHLFPCGRILIPRSPPRKKDFANRMLEELFLITIPAPFCSLTNRMIGMARAHNWWMTTT